LDIDLVRGLSILKRKTDNELTHRQTIGLGSHTRVLQILELDKFRFLAILKISLNYNCSKDSWGDGLST
jgi:hypothetical protein